MIVGAYFLSVIVGTHFLVSEDVGYLLPTALVHYICILGF